MKYRQKINGQWSNWINFNIKALDGMPIGSIIMFAGETIPTGWLICDGDTLNEEEYPELFDIIGHTYGGSNLDFNLPDFRGKTGFGYDDMTTGFYPMGNTGGEKAHTLTVDEMPSHNHDLTQRKISSQGSSGSTNGFSWVLNGADWGDFWADNTGGGQAHNNMPPYIVVNYIIKATNTTPTMASVVNATNNSTEDAYSCDYINNLVIGNHDNSDIGFVKLPGGIAICYGRYWPQNAITVPASSGSYFDITLPITMVAQQYTVIISKFAGGNGYASVMDAPTNFQADKFTINLWNNAGAQSQVVGYDWVAIGKYQ